MTKENTGSKGGAAMFEEYYQPIPDLNAYLERIGIKKEEPTLDYLNKVILNHQLSIPFESIDSAILKVPVHIDPQSLYEKIIVNKRGGYCFEMNSIFYELLDGLGFNVYSCMGKVMGSKDVDAHVIGMHKGNIVTIDGKYYYCDVGFGDGMPPGAVLIGDDERTVVCGEVFFIKKIKENWYVLQKEDENGSRQNIIKFSTFAQDKVDFIAPNFYGHMSPDCLFTYTLLVDKRLENGHVNIRNHTFTYKNGSEEFSETVTDRKRLQELLAEYFGINVELGEGEYRSGAE